MQLKSLYFLFSWIKIKTLHTIGIHFWDFTGFIQTGKWFVEVFLIMSRKFNKTHQKSKLEKLRKWYSLIIIKSIKWDLLHLKFSFVSIISSFNQSDSMIRHTYHKYFEHQQKLLFQSMMLCRNRRNVKHVLILRGTQTLWLSAWLAILDKILV